MTFKAFMISVAATAGFAFATPALADWDMDGDGGYSETEFGDGIVESGLFGDWDSDGDGALSQEEFATGNFSRYDRDGSGDIDEMERADVDRDFAEGEED